MPPLPDPRVLSARLRAELARPPGQARISRSDLLALVGYLQRCLRIMPFVRHAPDCRQAVREGKASTCTCGLQQAWSPDEAGGLSDGRSADAG